MKKSTIGLMMFVAGLLCSCNQLQQKGQDTQSSEFENWISRMTQGTRDPEAEGVEYERWNVLEDSITILKRLQKWETYVEEHPKDEMGWRNLYEARIFYSHFVPDYTSEANEKEFMARVKKAIPDTYTYYLLAMEASYDWAKCRKYGEEALKRLPERPLKEDYDKWCWFLYEKGGKRLDDMLTRYYESGLFPADVLYYHYNEMQGMEEGGIYFSDSEGDLIPKKMIQVVFGLHKDKVLVHRNGDWGTIWNQCKVPWPDDKWVSALPKYDKSDPARDWYIGNLMILDWIGKHSEHPVYYAAYAPSLHRKNMPREILKNLYNEGLLVRYSSKPYDNMAVACRNVEERYLLDYLYLPFVPAPQENEHYHSDGSWDVRNTVVLLQGLLPHYKKYNPERCHWLSGLLLKTIEQRSKQGAHTKDLFSDLEPDIRSYHEATKFVEP